MSDRLRHLQGITYWVLTDPAEIRRFINLNVRKEWERDDELDGVNPGNDKWLASLPRRKWQLRAISMSRLSLRHSLRKNGAFQDRLKVRADEMRRSLSEFNTVIWPVIVSGENHELQDGHCRFAALKSLGRSRVLAYVGSAA